MRTFAFILMIIVGVSCQTSPDKTSEKETKEARPIIAELNPEEVISQSIKGGERYLFDVNVEANNYFHIEAIQKNIDLKLVLHFPESDSTLTFDSPNGLLGTENIHHLSTKTGVYQVEVTPLSSYVEEGAFAIAIKTLRPATDEDQKWMLAFDARRAADLLRSKRETREEGIVAYEAVIEQWRELGDTFQVADATRALGFTVRNLGQNDRAIEVFTSLIPQWQNLGEVRFEAFTYIILAGIYKNQKDYKTALDLSFKGVEKWQEAGDLVQETKAISDIASFYMMTGEHEKAKEYYLKTMEMAKATGSLSLQGTMYRENGNAWQTFGDENKVVDYYSKSLECYEKMAHLPAKANAATLLGDFLSGKGNPKEARPYYEQALEVWKGLGYTAQISTLEGKISEK